MERTYYTWIAKSNDGSFTDKADTERYGVFSSREQCYYDMRDAVLNKTKWNTDYNDVISDDSVIDYTIEYAKDYIKHTSFSGVYLYKIIPCEQNGVVSNEEWEKLDKELGIKPKYEIKSVEEIEDFAEKLVQGRYTNEELENKISDFIGKKVEVQDCTDTSTEFDYMLTCPIYGDGDDTDYYLDIDIYYLIMRDEETMYITEVSVNEY